VKKISNVVCAVIIASGAAAAQAAGVDQTELEECKTQVSEYYAGVSDIKFVGQRQFRDGTRMKLAVHSEDDSTGYSTTHLATCWLGGENFQAYSGSKSNDAMVAEVDDVTPTMLEEILP
jgi:hypothetical protein